MISAVTEALSTIITWAGSVITALTSESGALAPLWPLAAIGIGVSVLFLGIKIIRGFAWGM